VIHRGYNINSKELEDKLNGIEGVGMSAVVGILDEK